MPTTTTERAHLAPQTSEAHAYYARPGAMTTASKYAAALQTLPDDLGGLVRVIQGVVLHEYAAEDLYGFRVPEERKSESHIRPAEQLLGQILTLDPRPFSVARPVDRRLIGVCRHAAIWIWSNKGGCPFAIRRFVGAWASKIGFEGGKGRQAMLIVTDVLSDGTALGYAIYGPPGRLSSSRRSAWYDSFAGKISDGILKFELAKSPFSAKFFSSDTITFRAIDNTLTCH